MGCHCLLWEDEWGTGAKAGTLLLIMKPSSLGREGVGRGKCVTGGAEAFCDTPPSCWTLGASCSPVPLQRLRRSPTLGIGVRNGTCHP